VKHFSCNFVLPNPVLFEFYVSNQNKICLNIKIKLTSLSVYGLLSARSLGLFSFCKNDEFLAESLTRSKFLPRQTTDDLFLCFQCLSETRQFIHKGTVLTAGVRSSLLSLISRVCFFITEIRNTSDDKRLLFQYCKLSYTNIRDISR